MTSVDMQQVGTTGRQVEEYNSVIQATWTWAKDSLSSRIVWWDRSCVSGAVGIWQLDNGESISAVDLCPVLTGTLVLFSGARPGYCNLRNRPDGKVIVVYHDETPAGPIAGWWAELDLFAGGGFFAPFPSVAPMPPGKESPGIGWPRSATSTCGADVIHHAVGTWSGARTETWYWRGIIFENGSQDSIHWDAAQQPQLLDPVSVGISNTIEAHGDTVAVVLARQLNPVNADVVYYLSTDCGVTWGGMNNITNYASSDPEGFWAELAAVFDPDGNLHVLWNTAPADDGVAPVNLYHWDMASGQIHTVTSAAWTNSCAGDSIPTAAPNNGAGLNNLAIAEPNLSVKPAGIYRPDELLYAVWTQYGPTDSDCATLDAVGTRGGHVNGEIYYSVSSNDGLTWDRPLNVSGTVSPDCLPGDCFSESWTTTAAGADSGVYISYIEDTHAGPGVLGGGVLTYSRVKVMAPEARPPVVEPLMAVTPTRFAELNADPISGDPDTVELSIVSIGNADLDYVVSVTNDDAGQSHVAVEGNLATSGTIPAGGAAQTISVSFHTTGLPDPSEHNWRLEITSNDAASDPGQGGSPVDVLLQVFAASAWNACEQDTLSTGLHRMAVSSCLEMGNKGHFGTGFFNYQDSSEWLVSGSPVITLVSGTDTLAYHSAFMGLADRTRAENKSFRAQSVMTVTRNQVNTVGDSAYVADKAIGVTSTTDTTIGIDYEMIFPRAPHMARGAVWTFAMRSLTGSPITGVSFGVVGDIDTDPSAGDNAGAGNPAKGWIGCVGGESDEDGNFTPNDSIMALFHVPQGGSCVRDGAAAAQVLANPNYVHPASAYETDSLYALFTTFGALGTWGTNIHIDTGQQFDDVSLMLVSGFNETIDDVALTRWGYGVAITDLGEADLETTIAALRAATVAACQIACLIEVDGDVNTSGSVTSADIIYLVNFVFKGDIEPQPCQANGDVNCSGSVTSADIIYLVGFVFKGAPPPCDICAHSGLPCN